MVDTAADGLLSGLDSFAQVSLGPSAVNLAQDTDGVAELETLALFLERSQGLTRSEAVDKAAQMYIAGKVKSEVATPHLAPSTVPKAKDWDAVFSTHKKIAGNQVKLSKVQSNFVVWLMGFRSLIDNVPLAQDHLEGVEHDVGFAEDPFAVRTARYCFELDKELGRVLLQTLEQDVSNILLPHHNSGERRSSVLFRTLRKELLRDDPASQDRVTNMVQNLKQNTHDVTTLADTFRYWFTYSSLLDNPIKPSDQVRYLLNSLHPRYNNYKSSAVFHRSTTEGKVAGFDYFVRQLLLEEANQSGISNNEHAFAVALQASSTVPPSAFAAQAYASTSSRPHQPSHSQARGGRDSSLGPRFTKARGRGSATKGRGGGRSFDGCRRCGQKGHWAPDCELSWSDANAMKRGGRGNSSIAALAAQEQQALVVAHRQH
ncbi:hypothetical protein CF326_g7859 [Tilletia indica]|uniref:Uncharacterized protein n=1 Tax=Tilletia indica TaxID=43049 RepID=A0A177TFH8_9BASI|nr:hypothetical protein CF326_g7859 [Tilletia indica]KAE8251128.1 hypothetical protein A4X13_0g4144 [Tilletia indica]